MRHVEMYRFRHIVVSGLYVAVPATLVLFQPELGSLLVMVSIWLGIMLVAGIRARHLIVLTLLGVLLLSFAWIFALEDYQKGRVLTFFNPQRDPYGQGYNVTQSLIAVGSGGIFGQGVGQGVQAQFGFLPEKQTDFIFAALVEELGVLGAAFLIILFAVLIWRIGLVAKRAQNNFARLAAVGFAIMIFSQATINIGMNLGLFPVTGIPLPLVSYGGSSIIMLFITLGFLQSIQMRS